MDLVRTLIDNRQPIEYNAYAAFVRGWHMEPIQSNGGFYTLNQTLVASSGTALVENLSELNLPLRLNAYGTHKRIESLPKDASDRSMLHRQALLEYATEVLEEQEGSIELLFSSLLSLKFANQEASENFVGWQLCRKRKNKSPGWHAVLYPEAYTPLEWPKIDTL